MLAALLPLLLDLLARHTLIVTVVPLSYAFRDFHLCIGLAVLPSLRVSVPLPRIWLLASQAKKLKCSLSSLPRAYVDVCEIAGNLLVFSRWRLQAAVIQKRTMRRSSPTKALPVARILLSPLAVSGMSEMPVWRPFRLHSVSPWRTMKTLGVVIL